MAMVTGSKLGPAKTPVSGSGLSALYSPPPDTTASNTAAINNYLASQGATGMGSSGPQAPTPAVGTPDDSIYENNLNDLNASFNNKQAQLANQRTQIQSQYGFDPQYANDPFTRANMLARAANNRFNQTTNSNAIRGQLYSGVLSADRNVDQFNADQAMDSARRQYAQALQANSDALLNAQTGLTEGQHSAYAQLLQRLTNSTPDASQQPGGTYDTSGYPNLNITVKAPKKGKKK